MIDFAQTAVCMREKAVRIARPYAESVFGLQLSI
jgi:hypothetical protein